MIPDAAYAEAGASVSADAAAIWGADAVVTIAPPTPRTSRGCAPARC